MPGPFDYFVLFAGMRTGSNFLESNLNSIDGVQCFGEAFNPHFIGYPSKAEVLKVTQPMRDADPERLLRAIRDVPGVMGGFRFFHDHDQRVLDVALEDPRCAKIVLTRNPLDSYVSWKIAQATGQWKLTNEKRRKQAKAVFDAEEFTRHVEVSQAFQVSLINRLQVRGQTAFFVAYDDLHDVDVINGLAAWLGVPGRLTGLNQSLKRQNPGSIASKVSNVDDMRAALANMDAFSLSRTPNSEPRRGASVPSYIAAANAPLVYMPLKGGPGADVTAWMAALDGVAARDLPTGMTQKQLRKWKRSHPGHRSFTVLRHPAERAHRVFCDCIVSADSTGFTKVRNLLRDQYGLNLPQGPVGDDYTLAMHRNAFETFLEFAKASISGKTAFRPDPLWCTQASALAGFGDFALPDFVLREEELPRMLPLLAELAGRDAPPAFHAAPAQVPFQLAEFHDEKLETLIADVYRRDYLMFGFGPWRKVQAA